MLNRAGLSMHAAYHERPPWEVEALLMSQVAESEARRRAQDPEASRGPLNPPDTPAPTWVGELDS